MKIKGMTVKLYNKTENGVDEFNKTKWVETPVEVDNVLVGEPTSEDVINEINLTGKHLAYTLGIPKGDNHVWEDRVVEFYGEKFKTFGFVTQGIEANIPLSWNKKIKVERYE